ncbi:hypothetical protein U1Q18_013434 [Sarracenia purpurea var. burkii]
MAPGYHACLRMMNYQQSMKAMERKLQRLKDKANSAKNEAHLLKVSELRVTTFERLAGRNCCLPEDYPVPKTVEGEDQISYGER